MIVALETVKAMSLNLRLNSKGLDPKRVAVSEEGVCAVGKLINNKEFCRNRFRI